MVNLPFISPSFYPNNSPGKIYKVVNCKLKKGEQNSLKILAHGSKQTVIKSNFVPNIQRFVLIGNKYTKKLSNDIYDSSKSDTPIAMNTLREESRENDYFTSVDDIDFYTSKLIKKVLIKWLNCLING